MVKSAYLNEGFILFHFYSYQITNAITMSTDSDIDAGTLSIDIKGSN